MKIKLAELRARLTEALDLVAGGEVVEVEKRGEVVAVISRRVAPAQAAVEVQVEASQPPVVIRPVEEVPPGMTCKYVDGAGVCGKPATHRHIAQWRCEEH